MRKLKTWLPVLVILAFSCMKAMEPGLQEVPEELPPFLELPEQTSDLRCYSHSFTLGGATYRNYTFGWDSSRRLSRWVAYPLCGFYTKAGVKRTEAWGYDPDVPSDEQPELFFSYRGSYDRGHQLPSADRLVCREANAQTFYFTNITPQRDVLNQGLWNDIETRVRSWAASSDTLYVVSGCVGEMASVKDAAGNSCPVPEAYYKAILRYSKTSGFNGLGIYVGHAGTFPEALTGSMVMSLSELEGKLGYGLYVNLGEAVGEDEVRRIKSENPLSIRFWGIEK